MTGSIVSPPRAPTSSGAVPRRIQWRFWHFALAAVLVAAGVLATLDAWQDIVRIAVQDEEQSHVFLVPLVAGWLFYVRRDRVRDYTPTANWVGPATIALGWGLNLAGDSFLIQSFWHFGAILVAVGGVLTVFGGGLLVRFLPVFASLLFLVPVPWTIRQEIAIPLQKETAKITQKVMETFGASVEVSGNVLRINQHDLMIAEACNGLRMVFALVMVSFTFAFGAPLRNGFRALVILASPVTAIVFNVARLVPTVWAYGVVSPAAADSLHEISGWLMLPCAYLALRGLMRLMRWAQIPITPYVLAHGF